MVFVINIIYNWSVYFQNVLNLGLQTYSFDF